MMRPLARGLVAVVGIATMGQAQDVNLPVYRWLGGSTPPANAITAPADPRGVICRAPTTVATNGPRGVGNWEPKFSYCAVLVSTGTEYQLIQGFEFLVPYSGTPRWERTPADDSLMAALQALYPPHSFPRPPKLALYARDEMIVADELHPDTSGFVICAMGGKVGMASAGYPQRNPRRRSYSCLSEGTPGDAVALIGRVLPNDKASYRWMTASAPPSNAVLSPVSGGHAACRTTIAGVGTLPGSWTDGTCHVATDGGPVSSTTGLQFLTSLAQPPKWSGSLAPVLRLAQPTPGVNRARISGLHDSVRGGTLLDGGQLLVCCYGKAIGYLDPKSPVNGKGCLTVGLPDRNEWAKQLSGVLL